MKIRWEAIEPAEVLSRLEHGVDWGTKRRLLIQIGTKQIWWQKGVTAWASRGTVGYYSAQLLFYDKECCDVVYIQKGGRLSKTMLIRLAPEIAKLLEINTEDLPELKQNITWKACI
jgi:hypothetical protein